VLPTLNILTPLLLTPYSLSMLMHHTPASAAAAALQAIVRVLSVYPRNGAKLNFFAAELMRRISGTPNDMAGVHPETRVPITFRVMTYHWSVIQVGVGVGPRHDVPLERHSGEGVGARGVCEGHERVLG
jgi:hypothetical protein